MPFQKLRDGLDLTDGEFDLIYPFKIQSLSRKHWTPVEVARAAANFLCSNTDANILDIGSGAGKFCFTGAVLHPECKFTGIDTKPDLIRLSNKIKQSHKLNNLSFVCQDIKTTNMSFYNGFYFFNSFQENIDETANMNNDNLFSYDAYKSYVKYLFDQLQQLPSGTKLATYHTSELYIPKNFVLAERYFNDCLKCYVKSDNKQNEVLDDEAIERLILINGS